MRLRVYETTKRAFDVVAAGATLVLLSPLLIAIGILVAMRLGRPILFRQPRPGLNGEVFELVKFRTMLNVDESRGLVTNAERMTPLGARLRSWSLDELPSLINIIRGDMSFVGPRPLLVRYLPLYSEEQARRHEVRPGLTGLAQVNGRNALNWDRRFELDLYYVDNRSWSLDVQIMWKTVLKVLHREGISTDGHVVGAPFAGSPRSESEPDE